MTKTQFKELIIHIAKNCNSDGNFGATKLNKILFFADYFYYLRTGETLTGMEYVHKQFGPVPDDMDVIKLEMSEAGDIAISVQENGMYVQEKVVALREPKLKGISAEKIAFLQKVLDRFCQPEKSWQATTMSNASHETVAWLSTKKYETINPLRYLFGTTRDQQRITAEDVSRAKDLQARYFPQYGSA